MLPNEETTRSDLAAKPGELEALLAVAGREQARPIVAFLREQRLNVTLVQDADSAFEEAVLHRPNLIVVHQDLPPSGGIEFCERLKANTRTHFLPTIIIATGNGANTRARAFTAGADAVFTAGDTPEERHARLWALLRTQALFRRHERKRESQGLALRERGQWLGSFMHDLQNAVGALQANFDFLTKIVPQPGARPAASFRPADVAECRDETHALLQQLAHGLRTVQDYERFESGRIGLKEALFAPVELLHEVCADVRSYGGTAVPAGLFPQVVEDPAQVSGPLPLCTGDRDLLRRGMAALIRLLQRRPGATTVRTCATRGSQGVTFLLGCDGESIEPTEEAQLFDPYAHSVRKGPIAERFELALARAIIDVHRGRLQVFGAPGAAPRSPLAPVQTGDQATVQQGSGNGSGNNDGRFLHRVKVQGLLAEVPLSHMKSRRGGQQRGPLRATAVGIICLLLTILGGLVPAPRMAVAGKLEELSHLLLEDESYKVRVQAAQLMGKLGDPAGVGPLGKALSDNNKTVRWMAVQALARLANPAAVPALKALLSRETDESVRTQAQKALVALSKAPGGTGDGKRPGQIYLTFGSFSGGNGGADAALLEVLRQALRRQLGKLPSVTFEGGDARSFGNSGQLGFFIDGNVSRLDGGGGGAAVAGAEINCDVKVMVARWPSKSIILWTNAGAAVTGGSRPQDVANARRDCLEASAGQLAEDLMKFFQSQGG